MVNLIARAVERDPQNTDLIARLGHLLGFSGRFAEANRLFERACGIADIGIHRRPLAGNYLRWTGDAAGAGRILDGTPEGSFDTLLLGLERTELRELAGDIAGAIADYHQLRHLPEWESLRVDYQFRQLMQEAEGRANAQPRPTAGLLLSSVK